MNQLFRSMAGLACMLLAQAAIAEGIYTCVDGKGRKITSDRQIAECADRSQQEITPSGTVKRVIGPTLTAHERVVQEEKERVAAETRALALEEKRRDRALLLRYPDKGTHDKERGLALAQVDEVIKASAKRSVELLEQRKLIDTEFEFYKKDPGKAPPPLKRRMDENESSSAVQKRFILDQDLEKRRVNLRFDEELVKLKQLWTLMGLPPGAVAAAAASGASAAVKSVKK